MKITSARERIAGWRETIRAPMPMNIISALSITAFLKEWSIFLPVAYSYISPSVMKME